MTQPAHNAQLSSPKRNYQLPAQHRNHQTQRKTKMPRVEGLLELFVMYVPEIAKKIDHATVQVVELQTISRIFAHQ